MIYTTSEHDAILQVMRHESFAQWVAMPHDRGYLEVACLHDTLYVARNTGVNKMWWPVERTALRNDSAAAPVLLAPKPRNVPGGDLAAHLSQQASPPLLPEAPTRAVEGRARTSPACGSQAERHQGNAETDRRLMLPEWCSKQKGRNSNTDMGIKIETGLQAETK